MMSEHKKAQILAAASECFARFGYKKTTLEDIGNKVGLNKASIYYYFPSKDEIFTTIVLNEFTQFITKLQHDLTAEQDCDRKILVYFEERLQFFHQKYLLLPQITEMEPATLSQIMASGLDVYLQIEREEKAFIANILHNCVQTGQIRACDVGKMSELLFALVEGIKEKSLGFAFNKSPTATELEQMINDVQIALTIFMKGLQ